MDQRSIILSALIATSAPLALAQSSVQLYGILDVGVAADNDGVNGRVYKVSNGFASGSRLGFRGTEDLGGGLSAVFNLEQAIAADTGALTSYAGQPGSTATVTGWNRRAIVGLQSTRWGLVTLGRDYTPFFHTSIATDPFALGLYGSRLDLVLLNGGSAENFHRASNGIFYTTPSMGGVTLRALASAGAERGTAPKNERRMLGLGADYRISGLLLSAGYQTDRILNAAGNATDNQKVFIGGAVYNFGGFSLSAGYAAVDPPGVANKRQSTWFGGSVNVSQAGQVLAQIGEMKFDAATGEKPKGRTIGVAYRYSFSKQTEGHITYGRVTNNSTSRVALYAAAATVTPAANGADPSGFAIGIRKRF